MASVFFGGLLVIIPVSFPPQAFLETAPMLPPWDSMMAFAMKSPNPVPPRSFLVVYKGRKRARTRHFARAWL